MQQQVQSNETDGRAILMPGFGPVQARRMTLMSVHFAPKVCKEFFHSGRRWVTIDKGSAESPAYCHVYDSQQLVPDTASMFSMEPGDRRPSDIPMPVRVETIVGDLLRLWCTSSMGASNKFSAGIILIKGSTATPDEISKGVQMEGSLCRALVEEADRYYIDPKTGRIELKHRQALEWLGSEKRAWYHQIEIGRMKTGALSGTRIPMEALADGGQSLLDFYIGSGLDPLDFGDTHVANLLKSKPDIRKTTERRLGMSKSKE